MPRRGPSSAPNAGYLQKSSRRSVSRVPVNGEIPPQTRGSRILQQKFTLYAGLLTLGLTASGPALAQAGSVYPAAAALPPYEIITIVRSTGLEPLSRPVRHGPTYALQAVDPAGREVRVVVDARLGRIVRIAPVASPRHTVPPLPPLYSRPPAGIAAVPDGYGPTSRVTGLSRSFDGPSPYGSIAGHEGLPVAPGRASTANAVATPATPTPLPRPRPKFAAAEAAAPTPAVSPQAPSPPAAANGSKDANPPAAIVEQHE